MVKAEYTTYSHVSCCYVFLYVNSVYVWSQAERILTQLNSDLSDVKKQVDSGVCVCMCVCVCVCVSD